MTTTHRDYTEVPSDAAPDVPYWVNRALGEVDTDVQALDTRFTQGLADGKFQRGKAPDGTNWNTFNVPGIWHISSLSHADTMTGLAVKWPSVVVNMPGSSLVAGQLQITYQDGDGFYYRSSRGAGTYNPWKNLSKGWQRGEFPAGPINLDDYYSLDQAGIWEMPVKADSDKVTGLPIQLPGTVELRSSRNNLATQIYACYHASGGVYVRRRTGIYDGTWTEWVRIDTPPSEAPPASSSGVDVALANSLRMAQFTWAMGGIKKTNGLPAVALRLDHGLNNYASKLRPVLNAKGIKSCIALGSRHWSHTENNMVTPGDVDSWVKAREIEIWNHSANTHQDTTTEQGLRDTIVTGLAELKEQLPSAKIHGFIVPGVGGTGYDGFSGGSTPEKFYNTLAGRLILEHHAVSSGAFPGTAHRVLDGQVRQGQNHFGMDSRGAAEIIAEIAKAQAAGGGLQLMLHPSLVDKPGYITTAQFTEVMEYMATERDAGRLMILSPYELLLADAT